MELNNFKEGGIDTFLKTTLQARKIDVPEDFSSIILERLHEKQVHKAAFAKRIITFSTVAAFGTFILLLSLFPAFVTRTSVHIQEYWSAAYLGIEILINSFCFVGFIIIVLYAFYILIDSLLIE